MQFLHACFHPEVPDSLFFFGEDPMQPAQKKRGRKPKNPAIHPHPHALSPVLLIESLLSFQPDITISETHQIVLNLPSRGVTPLLSDEPATGDGIIFSPIRIPALPVRLTELSRLFPAMNESSNAGITCRDSIMFFRWLYGLALECIAQELFIPGAGEDGSGVGRWTGVYPPGMKERVSRLSRAMPGICASWTEQPFSPDTIVYTFINSCIHALIQESCRNHPLPLHGRARSGSNPVTTLLFQLYGESLPGTSRDPGDAFPADIAGPLTEWLSPLSDGDTTRPLLTGIRLREPSESDSTFSLEFFVQARDDPSLIIPAEEIWKKRTRTISYLHHRFENPQEQMLRDLYTAGRIFSPIQDSLRTKAPSGLVLDNAMVYPFLSQAAPILSQSGISILLPSWWRDRSKKPRIQLSVRTRKEKGRRSTGSGIFTRDTLLSFDWKLSVGDVTLSPEEFENLVNLKTSLVHIGGKWAAFNPEDLKLAIETFTKKYPGGTISAMDTLREGLIGGGEASLPVDIVAGDPASVTFFSPLISDDRQGVVKRAEIPAGFIGELRPYQKTGLSWLTFMAGCGLGACLADDMGLGQTIQVIAYLLAEKENGPRQKNLLICPMSLIGNWQHELTRFAPDLSVYIHHGTRRAGDDILEEEIEKHDLIITTYQIISRDQGLMKKTAWDLLILDEAQNIKNSSTRQSQAVRALSGRRKIAMTGTPVENRLSELWSVMEFLNPGYLGGEKAFERNFGVPIEKYHDREASVRLQQCVRPFILRRVKTDRTIIADLPEKNVMKRFCTLTEEQATLYRAVVEAMITDVTDAEGIARKAMILAALLRLKQICNHPDAFLDDGQCTPERSGKISMLFSLIEEVRAAGDSAILFTQFPTFGQRLVDLMSRTFHEEILFLHGKTSRAARDEMVQRFAHSSGPRLFLLSLKAGGVGLNLTRASHVFHIDRWWNPAVEDQATDRAYRIGQEKNVAVHLLISAGTLEERIDQMIEEKRSLAGSIIGTGEDWITSLSTDELRELFSLRGELIGGE